MKLIAKHHYYRNKLKTLSQSDIYTPSNSSKIQSQTEKQKRLKHAERVRLRYHARRKLGKCGVAGCNKKSKKSVCKKHMDQRKERYKRLKDETNFKG